MELTELFETQKSHSLFILPSRSSPKLPHPIFFPTRKFGPTIKTPELAELVGSREPTPGRDIGR